MRVRRATPCDGAAVGPLLRRSFPADMASYLPMCQHGAGAYITDSLGGASPRGIARYVAEADDRVLGYAEFKDMSDRHAFLSYICVDGSARRQGVAGALLRKFEQDFKPRTLSLDVFANNTTARGMYEKTGFRLVGRSNWFVADLPEVIKGAERLDNLQDPEALDMLTRYGFCQLQSIWEGRSVEIGRIGDSVARVRDRDLFASREFRSLLANTLPALKQLLYLSQVHEVEALHPDVADGDEPLSRVGAIKAFQVSLRLTKENEGLGKA